MTLIGKSKVLFSWLYLQVTGHHAVAFIAANGDSTMNIVQNHWAFAAHRATARKIGKKVNSSGFVMFVDDGAIVAFNSLVYILGLCVRVFCSDPPTYDHCACLITH